MCEAAAWMQKVNGIANDSEACGRGVSVLLYPGLLLTDINMYGSGGKGRAVLVTEEAVRFLKSVSGNKR